MDRRDLRKAGFFAAGAGLWSGTLFQTSAIAAEMETSAEAVTIGRHELVMGLDGMSRVADGGRGGGGHCPPASGLDRWAMPTLRIPILVAVVRS